MWEHKHRGAVYNLAWGPDLKPPYDVREGSSTFDVRSIVSDMISNIQSFGLMILIHTRVLNSRNLS